MMADAIDPNNQSSFFLFVAVRGERDKKPYASGFPKEAYQSAGPFFKFLMVGNPYRGCKVKTPNPKCGVVHAMDYVD